MPNKEVSLPSIVLPDRQTLALAQNEWQRKNPILSRFLSLPRASPDRSAEVVAFTAAVSILAKAWETDANPAYRQDFPNQASLIKKTGVSQPTVKFWMSQVDLTKPPYSPPDQRLTVLILIARGFRRNLGEFFPLLWEDATASALADYFTWRPQDEFFDHLGLPYRSQDRKKLTVYFKKMEPELFGLFSSYRGRTQKTVPPWLAEMLETNLHQTETFAQAQALEASLASLIAKYPAESLIVLLSLAYCLRKTTELKPGRFWQIVEELEENQPTESTISSSVDRGLYIGVALLSLYIFADPYKTALLPLLIGELDNLPTPNSLEWLDQLQEILQKQPSPTAAAPAIDLIRQSLLSTVTITPTHA